MDNNFNPNPYNEPSASADSATPPPQANPVDGEYSIKYAPQSNVFSVQDKTYVPTSGAQYGAQNYSQPNRQYSQPTYGNAPQNGQYSQYGTPYAASDSSTASAASAVKRSRVIVGVIIGAMACAIIALIIALVAVRGTGTDNDKELDLIINDSPVTNLEITEGEPLSYAQVAAKVRRAVVGVTVYTDAYGWGSYTYSEGSGFIISDEGYIVTNSHVIGDEAYSNFNFAVTITDKNGENHEYEASVIGQDTRTDLAVLKIDPVGIDLVVAELGDSDSLVLGDEVVAIGNPGGEQFSGSVTNGIVSGLNRVIDESSGTSDSAMKYIQTNAAINPGNSGGPLLNMYGQVIGINTAKIVESGYESLGFAIPTRTALPIIEQLIEEGSVVRPVLGVSISEISYQTAQWYDVPQGLLIRGISTNSDLRSKGVEVEDIIIKCDDSAITTLSDLQTLIEQKKVGDKVTLTIFRAGQDSTFDVDVTLIADNDAGSITTNGRR